MPAGDGSFAPELHEPSERQALSLTKGAAQTRTVHCDGMSVRMIGPRSNAVFAASAQDDLSPQERTPVVLADTPELIAALPPGTIAVALSALSPLASVPAFDVNAVNPIGWKLTHDPPSDSTNQSAASRPKRNEMRRAHHVTDWTHGHDDAAVRAGELAAAAAAGAVVSLTSESAELEACLGSELYGLMSDSARIESADSHEREALSIAMRRAALRDHSTGARIRQVLAAAGTEAGGLPLVSVFAPTRRPGQLSALIDAVAAQTYPHIELVLGLHGDGFELASVEAQLTRLQFPSRTVAIASELSLGEVLNTMLEAATGDMVAKFDDDDLYGPHHLWDLVLAAEYSGAAMVGKVSEFVYLAGADRTIRRFIGLGERFIDPERSSVAGGAVVIRRDTLDEIGGWRPMRMGSDKALTQDIAASGGKVYRTHGNGYLLVRHGEGHTWDVEESYFLDQAHETRDGCDLRFAGLS